jgi:hypothetical protein
VNENKNTSDYFNPMVPQSNRNSGMYPTNGPTKADYQKYGWLFGAK